MKHFILMSLVALPILFLTSIVNAQNNNSILLDPEWIVIILTVFALVISNSLILKQISHSGNIYKSQKTDAGLVLSFEFLTATDRDDTFTDPIALATILKRDDMVFDDLLDKNSGDKYTEDLKKIYKALNTFESIAIGIHKKVLNEDVLRLALFDIANNLYQASEKLIDYLNKDGNNRNVYQYFKKMIKSWNQSGLDGNLPRHRI